MKKYKDIELSSEIKQELKNAVENVIEYIEEKINVILGEVIDDLNIKELKDPIKRVEALALAREVFFRG
jgi:hypothetical protein